MPRPPARVGPLGPARRDRPGDEPRERQLHRGDAVQAARCGDGRGRDARPRGGRIVVATMREAGIPVTGVRIVDGSGLSSLDRLTAEALVGVMRAGAADPVIRRASSDSLAVAGRSGTMSQRLLSLTGRVRGKTGTTDLACTLSGLRQRHIRLRGAGERKPGLVLGGPRGAGPLRQRARRPGRGALRGRYEPAVSSAVGPPRRGSGTPAFSAFATFEPGFSPTITPVVFFETESETLAPSASSAVFASSRLKPSSVPVRTYCVSRQRPLDRSFRLAGLELQPERRGGRRRARGSRRPRTTPRSARPGRGRSLRPPRAPPGVAAISASTVTKCRARLRASTQPTFGMLSPNRTRENGCCFERSIASIARAAEISP